MATQKQKSRQSLAIHNSDTYDDTLSAGSGMESPSGDDVVLEWDLNNLRSQLKRVTGETNWYDALSGLALKTLSEKILVYRMPQQKQADKTLSGGESGFLVAASDLDGGGGTIAVGASSTDDGGYVAADESNFTVAGSLGVGTTTAVDGDGVLLNEVAIFDADTNDTPKTADGEEIFGLLQVISGTSDGAAVAGGGSENLQVSFVFVDQATDNITATTLPAGDYHWAPSRQHFWKNLNRGSLLSNGSVPALIDAGGAGGRLAQRAIEITGTEPNADDPMTITNGNFATAGSQTSITNIEYGTPALPDNDDDWLEDSRISIWLNGQKLLKGTSGTKQDVYRSSTTQIAFPIDLVTGDIIMLETPSAY